MFVALEIITVEGCGTVTGAANYLDTYGNLGGLLDRLHRGGMRQAGRHSWSL